MVLEKLRVILRSRVIRTKNKSMSIDTNFWIAAGLGNSAGAAKSGMARRLPHNLRLQLPGTNTESQASMCQSEIKRLFFCLQQQQQQQQLQQ